MKQRGSRHFPLERVFYVFLGGVVGALVAYSSSPCQQSLESISTQNRVVLNFAEIRTYQKHLRLKEVANKRKDWAVKKYQMDEPAGQGHYAFLGYLSSMQKHSVIIDVGTRWGDSARALASEASSIVYTFDIMNAADRIAKANSCTVEALEEQLGNVQFFQNINILKSRRGLAYLKVANVVLLDTLHQPDKNRFEYDFVDVLLSIDFQGILVCDDIHLNSQMEKWWNSIKLKKYDLTTVGHKSGTGVVDFSGNTVEIRE